MAPLEPENVFDKSSLISNEEASVVVPLPDCHRCDHPEMGRRRTSYTRRKLLCLVFVASLAFCTIVLISEQLISRHFFAKEAEEELEFITIEEWISSKVPIGHPVRRRPTTEPRGIDLIEDGIFWGSELEARVPPGPSEFDVQAQMQELRSRPVTEVNPPDWLHCGRDKNRFIAFQDGSRACARYRDPHRELVQGEIMAFYLARLLGIRSTPAVVLSEVNGEQWDQVRTAVNESGWEREAITALIAWLPEELTKMKIPGLIRKALESGVPINSKSELNEVDAEELADLVQWSDMIIFDYITGNYDRVASMQDAVEKEERPSIFKETVHNLVKSVKTGLLWFIDNESALLDAYALLYESVEQGKRFQEFHRRMLSTVCIFRKKTVDRIFAIQQSPDPGRLLLKFINGNEPLFRKLPTIHPNSIFANHFGDRLQEVWSWIQQCQEQAQY